MKNNIDQILANAPELQADEGLDVTTCSPLLRYKWRVGGTLDLYDSGDIYPSQDGEWVRWKDVQDMIEALKCAEAEKIGWKDAVDHALAPILSMENVSAHTQKERVRRSHDTENK